MHRGPRVGLGQVQELGRAGQPPHPGRELGEAVRDGPGLGLPQDAEAGIRDGAEGLFAVERGQVVLAVPEEREVVVLDPLQESAGLRQVLLLEIRRGLFQTGDDIVDPLAHLLPVLDRRPHVGEGLLDRLLQVIEHLRLRLAVHLDVDHRLRDGVFVVSVGGEDLDQAALVVPAHLHEGVQDHVYGVALAVYLHPRRIHEEGHVVVDHLHHGVGRLPAVLLEDGVVDPDLPLPRLAPAREVPVGDGGPVGVYGGAVFQVVRVHPAVVLARELLDLRVPDPPASAPLRAPRPCPEARPLPASARLPRRFPIS